MTRALPLLTLFLALAFAGAPLVSDPFSGFAADQLPNPQPDPPVQPAGYAFGIWGLIYAWLVISAGYGLWRRAGAGDWNRARPALIVSLAIGVPWLAIANASAIWATITIFLMAGGAIWALLSGPSRDRWFFRYPVGLYAGWLTAASFVSLGSTAAGYGWLMGQLGWAWAAIALALVVSGSLLLRAAPGLAYGIAVVWALIGIVVGNGMAVPSVSLLALSGALIVGALTIRLAARTPPPAA